MDTSTLLDDELEATDEPEDQNSEQEHPEEDELLSDEEIIRRNAARKISSQGQDLRSTDLELVSLIAESPEKAPDIIARIKGENPKLAQRLQKLYVSRERNNLSEKFKDPVVAEAFEALSTQVETLTQKTAQQAENDERRTFKNWKRDVPELEDKALKATFKTVLDTVFPDQLITEDVLNDALALAKHRSGWQDEPTRKAADRIAVEQAIRGRQSGPPRGGRGISSEPSYDADPQVADMFGSTDPDRLKKIAEAKKKARF